MKIDQTSFMDPATQEDPFDYYDALLSQAPVYFMKEIGAYVVSKYEDIRYVVAHPEIWSIDMSALPQAQLIKTPAARKLLEEEGFPRDTRLTTDPPVHTQYRMAVHKAFTPQRVKSHAAFIQSAVDDLTREMAQTGQCEFMRQFAWRLPMLVITRLLGVPYEDADTIKHWSDVWVEPLAYGLSEEREIYVAQEEIALQKYLLKHMEMKKTKPGEDILTELANARMADGSEMKLSEKIGLAEHLIVGGHETATSALGSGMMLLAQNPSIAEELRAAPNLVETFTEEVLRLESPSAGFFRLAIADANLRGVHIPKGAMVHLRFAAANRDPDHFETPRKLDLHRKNAQTHLGFSQGPHFCLGSPYARLELNTAFRTLVQTFDDIRLAPGAPPPAHVPGLSLRTLKALPITYRRIAN
jgi:cytochrome P450